MQFTCEGVNNGCAIDCRHYLINDRAVVKCSFKSSIWVLHGVYLHKHLSQLDRLTVAIPVFKSGNALRRLNALLAVRVSLCCKQMVSLCHKQMGIYRNTDMQHTSDKTLPVHMQDPAAQIGTRHLRRPHCCSLAEPLNMAQQRLMGSRPTQPADRLWWHQEDSHRVPGTKGWRLTHWLPLREQCGCDQP